jgi:hypothetical protein
MVLARILHRIVDWEFVRSGKKPANPHLAEILEESLRC